MGYRSPIKIKFDNIKWFFYSAWVKLTYKMPSKFALRITTPKFIDDAYTNLVPDPCDLTTANWEGAIDTKMHVFYIIKNSRMRKVKCIYNYRKDGE